MPVRRRETRHQPHMNVWFNRHTSTTGNQISNDTTNLETDNHIEEVSCNTNTSVSQTTQTPSDQSEPTVSNTHLPPVTNDRPSPDNPKDNANNQIALPLIKELDTSLELSTTTASQVDPNNTDALPIHDTEFNSNYRITSTSSH
jgi:LAS superfamily LD-carboxypeptidase LdcB